MKNQTDVYEKITASIIEAIEAGCGKFEMPWHTFGSLPFNAGNKRRYRGINVLVLWAAASQRGYKTQLWATYQQWRELGAQVRQGEKSTAVVFGSFTATITTTRQKMPKAKTQRVRPSDASPVPITSSTPTRWTGSAFQTCRHYRKHSVFSKQRSSSTAQGRESSRPACTPATTQTPMRFICRHSRCSKEQITSIRRWRTKPSISAVTFLGAIGSWEIGSAQNSMPPEELVAELGSAFLSAELQLETEPRTDNAPYIENWLKVLKNDKRAIFTAAGKAQQAVDWINARVEDVRAA